MADSVVVRIVGDDSAYKKTLQGLGETTKSAFSWLATVTRSTFTVASAAVGAAASAVVGLGVSAVKYNASIEQLQTSFEVMTGSAEKAEEVLKRIRTMGAATPYDTAGLASTVQLLMQYGFSAEEAVDTMAMLGDVAQGSQEKMMSIATGYAQMSSAGKVNLQDIKQMINAGFNPLQEISTRTGESMDSLYDRISKGTITLDEITESIRAATSEGGQFFGSMEKQSQTFNGQVSTMKDNWATLTGSIFAGTSEILSAQVLPMLNGIIGEAQEAFDKNGLDGLMSVLNRRGPELVAWAADLVGKMASGIAKRLPAFVQGIVRQIPNLLNTAVDLIPQLTETGFSLLSSVVSNLIGMLPELVPMLVKGAISLVKSVGKGLVSLLGGVMTGIETAVFGNIEDTAGTLARMVAQSGGALREEYENAFAGAFEVDYQISTDAAAAQIQAAWDNLHVALMGVSLTQAQLGEITDLIGQDYEAIYQKLVSFGLDEKTAAAIARQVSEAGKTIRSSLGGLNVDADADTVLKWYMQANGSRLRLRAILMSSGLSAEDQQAVMNYWNENVAATTANLPNFISEIYDALTDGQADDTDDLLSRVKAGTEAALKRVDDWLAAEVGKLDTNAADYADQVAVLNEQAATWRAEIQATNDGMVALVNELSGQPAAVVQKRMEEFAAYESMLADINAEIDATLAKQREQQMAVVTLVKSGATEDSQTVAQAFAYTSQTHQARRDSAQEQAKAEMDAFNEAWAAEYERASAQRQAEMAAEYEAQKAALEQKQAAEMARIEAEYQAELTGLFGGLASRLPQEVQDSMLSALKLEDMAQQMREFYRQIGEEGADKAALLEAIAPTLDAYAAYMNETRGLFHEWNWDTFFADGFEEASADEVEGMIRQLDLDAADAMKGLDLGAMGAAYAQAVENGMLTGLTDSAYDQLGMMIGARSPEYMAKMNESLTGESAQMAGAGEAAADAFSDAFGGGLSAAVRYARSAATQMLRSLSEVGGYTPASAAGTYGGGSAANVHTYVFSVNGRKLATATRSDTGRVNSQYTRSIAMGFGVQG